MRRVIHLARHRLVAVICSRLCVSAAGMLLGIVLARALGPSGLGSYANLVATAAVAGTLLCLGMEIPYNLSATANPRAGGNLLLLVTGQAGCGFVLALLICGLLSAGGHAPGTSPALFGLVTAAFVLNQLTQPVMSGLQKQVQVNTAMAGLLLAQAAAIAALAYGGLANIPVALAMYAASLACLMLIFLRSRLRERERCFSYRDAARGLFAQGRHYMLATLGGIIRLRAAVVIMGWYLPPHEIGNYQVMQTLTETLYLVPVTVSTYVLSLRTEGRQLARDAALVSVASCATTILCTLAVALALQFLVPALYGPGFSAAVTYGPIVLTGAIAFAISKGISAYFSRLGQAKLVTRVEVITTAVALASFAILIPQAGLAGAVWGFVLASWFGASAYAVQLVAMARSDAFIVQWERV